MPRLELTTTFRSISTAQRHPEPDAAYAAGAAHIRYIDRPSAVGEWAASGLQEPATGIIAEPLDPRIPATKAQRQRFDLAQRRRARAALRAKMRAALDGAPRQGVRVMEKIILSLPNDWSPEARQNAAERVAQHLAPSGSEVGAFVVCHLDKSHNSHLHAAVVDGRESIEAARLRAGPDAKRIRRRNVLRLGDKRRARQLRAELAGILNAVAAEFGGGEVEHRSFKSRGIERAPGKHRGLIERARPAIRKRLLAEADAAQNAPQDTGSALHRGLSARSRD